jgi:hypothetical protein
MAGYHGGDDHHPPRHQAPCNCIPYQAVLYVKPPYQAVFYVKQLTDSTLQFVPNQLGIYPGCRLQQSSQTNTSIAKRFLTLSAAYHLLLTMRNKAYERSHLQGWGPGRLPAPPSPGLLPMVMCVLLCKWLLQMLTTRSILCNMSSNHYN